MKRVLLVAGILLAGLMTSKAQTMPDAPFGWATSTSLTSGDDYALTGGGSGKVTVLRSNGRDMRYVVEKALKFYDVLVFDGSAGDFIFSTQISLNGVKNKTLMGINNARIKTSFEVTPELKQLLNDAGVKSMSTMGGGGTLSNGIRIAEERETHTRQAIIDKTGDQKEAYRASGLFQLNGCENMIFRNLDLVGPGPIDVGGADILTISNGSNHIWVDHCSFTDGMDGNFDINNRADFITVSWCIFKYTDRAYDHKVSNLIGSNDSPSQGVDNLNVTFAYCIWGEGCEGRMPFVRQGNIHLLNNYYNCPGAGLCMNPGTNSEMLIEGNYFAKGVTRPFSARNAKAYAFKGNVFKEKFTPEDFGELSAFPYKYTTVKASTVPNLTKKSGPTLALTLPEGAEEPVLYDAVVAADGSGDFKTIQEAVNAMPDYLTRKQNTILVMPGTYYEKVQIPCSKANLKIKGSGAEETILVYDDYAYKVYPGTTDQYGTFGTPSLFIDANDVTLEDITIQNSSGKGEVVGQALAVTVNGDRVFFHRCRILGHQDTVYTHGHYGDNGNACRYYFLDCYIEGTTDFIFGQGTGLFENCLIRSKKNSHVTAASTLQGQKYGYVFRKCKFIADEGIDNVSLGRPWKDYARVVYLECELGAHIRPTGWDNWGSKAKEQTAYYAEYKNFGPGANPDGRLPWTHQLTDEEAAEYTFEKIMAAPGEMMPWNPLQTR